MLGSKTVLVIGTGTIGEPLIGLLCTFKAQLGLDEVLFHKRTPLMTDRSKVLSVYLMVLLGASPLGSLTLGFVAEATSPRLAVTINALALLLVVGAMAASGRLAALNGERDDAAEAAEPTPEADRSSSGS